MTGRPHHESENHNSLECDRAGTCIISPQHKYNAAKKGEVQNTHKSQNIHMVLHVISSEEERGVKRITVSDTFTV